ncbi:MAG: hypothetical protein WCS37_02855, partial [Chloroflexota bacterium]
DNQLTFISGQATNEYHPKDQSACKAGMNLALIGLFVSALYEEAESNLEYTYTAPYCQNVISTAPIMPETPPKEKLIPAT